jgi:hypothetical protein
MRDFVDDAIAFLEGHNALDGDRLAKFERGYFVQVSDPEGLYFGSRHVAYLGATDMALREFARAVDGGYFCYLAFRTDKWLDRLRGREPFEAAMARARERHLEAIRAFKAASGERIVGVRVTVPD